MSAEDDFLTGGGSVTSASFLTKGTTHEGYICEPPSLRQQLDMDTREPKFWKNGDKMMQLVVTLQTEENDREVEDDDGKRRLYVKYKMREAIADALKAAAEAAGVEKVSLQEGGWLSVTHTGSEKPKKRGFNGTKLYEASYEPPDPSAEADAYLSDDDDGADDPEPPPPPRRAPAKKAPAKRAAAAEPDDDEPPARSAPPRKAGARRPPPRRAAADDEGEPAF